MWSIVLPNPKSIFLFPSWTILAKVAGRLSFPYLEAIDEAEESWVGAYSGLKLGTVAIPPDETNYWVRRCLMRKFGYRALDL